MYCPEPLITIIQRQCALTPERPAIWATNKSLSYGQLNSLANHLARHIVAAGAGPHQFVGIYIEHGWKAVVAILAVWKAGAAYLPLGTEDPTARTEWLLKDARPVCVIGEGLPPEGVDVHAWIEWSEVASCFGACTHGSRDVDAEERLGLLTADCPAYLIYTSGSTGKPKGVVIPHIGLRNIAETHAVAPDSHVLLFAPMTFDASVADLCTALPSGACLAIPVGAERTPGAPLADFITRAGVTHFTLPPSVLRRVPEHLVPPGMHLIVAGEMVPKEIVDLWTQRHTVRNVYGQTETTIATTMSGPLQSNSAITAGPPLKHTHLHILGECGEIVPVGASGQIFVAGVGVGRGYWNRPDLTETAFLPDQVCGDYGRMYRTGDRGYLTPDGELVVEGRLDDQIKLNGQRIELGEIEAVLKGLPQVADAAVAPIERRPYRSSPSLKELLIGAYVVPSGGETLDLRDLRSAAGRILPRHMLPSIVVEVAALPLTTNGKLDRDLLERAVDSAAAETRNQNDPEQQMCALCSRILGAKIGPDDDFFARGGTSLDALLLVSEAHRQGWVMSPADVYRERTPGRLARLNTQSSSDSDGRQSI